MVLKLTSEPDGLDAYVDEVNRRLAEYNSQDPPHQLSLSYGVSFYDGGGIDSFLKEMDTRMYEMKAEHHRQEQ